MEDGCCGVVGEGGAAGAGARRWWIGGWLGVWIGTEFLGVREGPSAGDVDVVEPFEE